MTTIKKNTLTKKLQTKNCKCQCIVPLELTVGKKQITGDYGTSDRELTIDWHGSNIINAHLIRVTKYLCTECMRVIEIPLEDNEIKK